MDILLFMEKERVTFRRLRVLAAETILRNHLTSLWRFFNAKKAKFKEAS